MVRYRLLGVIVLVLMLLPASSAAEDPPWKLKKQPQLDEFSVPELEPGASGTLEFVLVNNLDHSLANGTLTMELYSYSNLEKTRSVTDLDNIPELTALSGAYDARGADPIRFELETVEPGEQVVFEVRVKTSGDTERGYYSLRFKLEFDLGNAYVTDSGRPQTFELKSAGHLDPGELRSINTTDYPDDCYGIISETSFSVVRKDYTNLLYFLGATTLGVFCAAGYLYFWEKRNEG